MSTYHICTTQPRRIRGKYRTFRSSTAATPQSLRSSLRRVCRVSSNLCGPPSLHAPAIRTGVSRPAAATDIVLLGLDCG
eukprot:5456622-Pleurochrysis_carterae.AAC.1